jgi:hypothetical protein
MSERDDDRPATRNDLIYVVFILTIAMMLLSTVDSCSHRIQLDKLREDLRQR